MLTKGANDCTLSQIRQWKNRLISKSNLMVKLKNKVAIISHSIKNMNIDELMRKYGDTEILFYAVKHNQTDIVKLMLEKILDIDYYNIALEYAAESGNITIIKLLIEYGANDYDNVLIIAAKIGRIDIVELMLAFGAKDYTSALEYASRGGHINIVKLMIKKGADHYNLKLSNIDKYTNIELYLYVYLLKK